jgi:transcription elongation factor Elf1
MSTVTKYLVYGPNDTLRRLPLKLFEEHEPKYLYKYEATEGNDLVFVSVYEQFEKQINATITVTCIIECTNAHNRIEMKKAGGRMGFRGSSLTEEKNVESDLVDFIMDFSKRFGLSLQEEVDDNETAESEEEG